MNKLKKKTYFYLWGMILIVLFISIITVIKEKQNFATFIGAFILLSYAIYVFKIYATNYPHKIEYNTHQVILHFLFKKISINVDQISSIEYPGNFPIHFFKIPLNDAALIINIDNKKIPIFLKYYKGIHSLYKTIKKNNEETHTPITSLDEEKIYSSPLSKIPQFYSALFIIIFGVLTVQHFLETTHYKYSLSVGYCLFLIVVIYAAIQHLREVVFQQNSILVRHKIFPFIHFKKSYQDIRKIIFLDTYGDNTIQIYTTDFEIKEYKVQLVEKKDIPKITSQLKEIGIEVENKIKISVNK